MLENKDLEMNMKIIISGSRTWDWFSVFEKAMLNVVPELQYKFVVHTNKLEFITGGAKGVDSMAENFCKKYGLKNKIFPANWYDLSVPGCVTEVNDFGKQYNKRAGIQRNMEMLWYANDENIATIDEINANNIAKSSKKSKNALIAFQVEKSKGTENMIKLCKEKNMPIILFTVEYGVQLKLSTFNYESVFVGRYR